MSIITVDPFTDKRWDQYIQKHPQGTIFHHSAWARVLQERYGTAPDYYAVENTRREITAVAPFFSVSSPLGGRRLVCLPASEYCYPLADDSQDISLLIERAKEEVRTHHLSFLEVRGFRTENSPQNLGLKENPYYLNHVTTLEGQPQDLRASFSRETRYHINRGEKSGVKIRLAEDEQDLRKYHLLTSAMRRRINLLPWPYRFFYSIYRNLIVPGYGFLMVAELNGEIVSGGLFLQYKDTVINKFNASDTRYIQLRTNYLLMWRALEYAYSRSCRFFDFGITNPENSGLLKFKSHWNSRQTDLPYYYYPEVRGFNSQPETSLIYRAHTAVNRLLPDFALKLAADLLYRRMG